MQYFLFYNLADSNPACETVSANRHDENFHHATATVGDGFHYERNDKGRIVEVVLAALNQVQAEAKLKEFLDSNA